jgi:CDP-Glycerol:Poly(glycerophosphate) glycerophosphotransferase
LAPTKLSLFWAVLWCPIWLLFLHPFWSRGRSRHAPWVIGGHRGRLYADNAAAVEAEARAQGREIFWIGNAGLLPQLKAQNIRTLKRHSWAARRAISQAPVLIYSHGEDDLDTVLILLRGKTGLRVYLNHSLNLLKAGGVLDPQFLALASWLRAIKRWLITDCDAFLTVSEQESFNFKRSYPMHAKKMHPGGGAHLDAWCDAREVVPQKRIYWFPTFRETTAARQRLHSEIQHLCSSEKLRTWLIENDLEFFVGTHVNTGANHEGSALVLPLEKPFSWAQLGKLGEDVRSSEILISDYSGMIFNFLLLDRPVLLFPFDLEDYLKRRALYVGYDELNFACQAKTAADLIELLTSEAWRAPGLNQAARKKRAAWLPSGSEKFASKSVDTINQLADEFWKTEP